MFPMDRRVLHAPVTIEYDCRRTGKRVTKVLPNAFAARRFYARKLREGRNPAVVAKQCA